MENDPSKMKTKLEVQRKGILLASIVARWIILHSSVGEGSILSVSSAMNLDIKLSFVETKPSSKKKKC